MDAEHFDVLTRQLNSRRVALGGLAAGVAALTGWLAPDATEARKRRKKKRKKKNKKKFPPPGPPPPTCTDGIKNGDESEVDCGGSCPRRVNGITCASRDDCVSALCDGGTCQACTFDPNNCGNEDSGGVCLCDQMEDDQQLVCSKRFPAAEPVGDCDACPAGTNCVQRATILECFKPCGAA